VARFLSTGDGIDATPAPELVVQRLAGHHPEVARELEHLLDTMREVAALAERSVGAQGEAATLAWLTRLWHEVDRELRWCGSVPQDARHASASIPIHRRRRDEIGAVPTPPRKT
jgi:hypothetical protein